MQPRHLLLLVQWNEKSGRVTMLVEGIASDHKETGITTSHSKNREEYVRNLDGPVDCLTFIIYLQDLD